jgi:hypothetical protein
VWEKDTNIKTGADYDGPRDLFLQQASKKEKRSKLPSPSSTVAPSPSSNVHRKTRCAREDLFEKRLVEGFEQMEGETPKRPQPNAYRVREAPMPQVTDSIAPTEFPKVRSATESPRL